MDGGITDNQGLDSALLADNRRRNAGRKEFDLIIVTDVASYYMDSYVVPMQKNSKSWAKLTITDIIGKVYWLFSVLKYAATAAVAISLVSLFLIIFVDGSVFHNIGYFSLGLSISVLLLLGIVSYFKRKAGLTAILMPKFDIQKYIRKQVPSINHFSDDVIDKLISYFKNTRLGILAQMISSRIRSVLIMVSDINLKHVRRLIYHEFYDDPRWEHRRCPNFIYDLSKKNEVARQQYLMELIKKGQLTVENVDLLQVSNKIVDVAEEARLVGTTLWYEQENDDKLMATIACGQFSICCNLLQYILLLENDSTIKFNEETKKMVSIIKEKLVADWVKFKTDPIFLFNYCNR